MKIEEASFKQRLRGLRPRATLIWAFALSFVALVASLSLPWLFGWAMGWSLFISLALLVDAGLVLMPFELGVERICPEQVEENEQFSVQYRFLSPRTLSMGFVDEFPREIEYASGEEAIFFKLTAQIPLSKQVQVRALQRGLGQWGALNLFRLGALGLFTRRLSIQLSNSNTIRIYPELGELDAAYLDPRLMLADLGIKPKPRRGDGSEFHRIRQAQYGDNLKRIDWRATARRGKPMVRDYRPEQCDDIILGLDHGRLMGARMDDGKTKLDHAMDAFLRLSLLALSSGDRVGFVSFAQKPGPWVKPKSGRQQLGRLMLAAYELKPSSVDANHAAVMLQIARRQSKRALIILFTDFVDEQASGQMVEALRLLRQRHRVLLVGVADPLTEDVLLRGVRNEREALLGLAALHQDLARTAVLNRAAEIGVDALDLSPREITAGSINAYLKIRTAGIS